jgi:ubiquinone/menaquinone biosynthesis C-methylase UbiE
MPDHKKVYQNEGDRYQQLIFREDYQGNLLPALERILNLRGLDVLDLGAGTGRLSLLLAPIVRSVQVMDLSTHMLLVALDLLQGQGNSNWNVFAADHRNIPLLPGSADLIISGWSFCYLVVWEDNDWQDNLEQGLNEIKRLLRPAGKVIIIETLGTGNTEPVVIDKLGSYLAYLEKSGFKRDWVRTDYQFEDLDEAEDLVEFFFGSEMLGKITRDNKPILPECTGIWHWPG